MQLMLCFVFLDANGKMFIQLLTYTSRSLMVYACPPYWIWCWAPCWKPAVAVSAWGGLVASGGGSKPTKQLTLVGDEKNHRTTLRVVVYFKGLNWKFIGVWGFWSTPVFVWWVYVGNMWIICCTNGWLCHRILVMVMCERPKTQSLLKRRFSC